MIPVILVDCAREYTGDGAIGIAFDLYVITLLVVPKAPEAQIVDARRQRGRRDAKA